MPMQRDFCRATAFLPTCLPGRIKDYLVFSLISRNPWGNYLVELADEIPPVVVNPGRPQAIFLMKENFFSSAMYGSLSPEDTIKQMREAMKAGFGGPPEE